MYKWHFTFDSLPDAYLRNNKGHLDVLAKETDKSDGDTRNFKRQEIEYPEVNNEQGPNVSRFIEPKPP